ncbi:preprotein translocase subunit SecG [Methylosinus sp. PW1]|uniref:preprotein translocase subunit SecG n=1 Tax=Methylosinus TaxID=425 RepID=UPI00056AF77C|nr:preprotein translocase subunit SecG [Methylosinus sp. PW1]
MQQVIIVIHLMVVVALVVLILYQKSEGGALGIGGGGGLFTGRGQANAVTRATGILGAIFFLTSIALTVLPAWERGSGEGLDPAKLELKEVPAAGAPAAGASTPAPAEKKESIFDQLQRVQQQRQGATPPAAESPAAAPATEGAKEPEAKAPEGADKAPAEQK